MGQPEEPSEKPQRHRAPRKIAAERIVEVLSATHPDVVLEAEEKLRGYDASRADRFA